MFSFIAAFDLPDASDRDPAAFLRRTALLIGERMPSVGPEPRIAVEVFQSCRECPPCRAGEYRRCVRHGLGDMYGFIPVERAPGLWGGYAEYQYLGPDAMVVRVPS